MSPEFIRAFARGVAESVRVCGESFDWQGESYSGVPAEAGVDVAMLAMGGSNSSADFVLTCSRDQFATVPKKLESITWRGGMWKIVEVKSPGDPFTVILHVKKRVE